MCVNQLTGVEQQLVKLTKIGEQNRSMKIKIENGAFIAENFVTQTKKKQVAALQISKQHTIEYSKKHLETTLCQITKCKY